MEEDTEGLDRLIKQKKKSTKLCTNYFNGI